MKYYDIASLDSAGGEERQVFFCSTLKDTDLNQLPDGTSSLAPGSVSSPVNSGESLIHVPPISVVSLTLLKGQFTPGNASACSRSRHMRQVLAL